MRKLITLLSVLMLYSIAALAQTKTITGKIATKDGQPIEGASIRLQGTKTGTVTNGKGEFKINAKEGTVLLISAIAFNAEKITVGSSDRYTVVLNQSISTMDEVVVTAGGLKARKKEQGYNATDVKGEELVATKPVDVAASLSGKVAGLEVSDVSGGVNPSYRLVLRGQRSLLGNNQALIVLDGSVVPNAVLGNLNPQDIENIEVLNGASAVALYGSDASNGALIVTTKKGRKGATSVGIAQTFTAQSVAFFPKLQTEFGGGGNGYGVNPDGTPVFSDLENQSYGPRFNGSTVKLGNPLEDGSQQYVKYSANNDRKKFWNTGITNQTDFNLTTGGDNSTIYLAGQYANVTGIMPGDAYNRATLRLNGTQKLVNHVSAQYSLGYTQNRYNITTQTNDIYNNLLNIPANVPILEFKDWQTNKFANPNGYENPWYQNPYFEAANNREHTRNDYLIGNVQLDWAPVSFLNFTYRLGLTTDNISDLQTVDKFTYTSYAITESGGSKSNIAGGVTQTNSYYTRLTSDLYFTAKKTIRDFSFNLVGGTSLHNNRSDYTSASVSGLNTPGLFNFSNSYNKPTASNGYYQARLVGAYGDFKIGFHNYLFLDVTGRNDWVSILNPPNNSFFYPSVGLSFMATDAIRALKDIKGLDYLKLRGSWSKVGQVNLTSDPNSTSFGAYSLMTTFAQQLGFPYNGVPGYTMTNTVVQNPLLPEITKGYEFGGDFALFNSRVSGSVTYYATHTTNQTIPATISITSGFTNFLLNSGEVSNKGLETKLDVIAFKSRNWTVDVGGNYSHYNNQVISINSALVGNLQIAAYGAAGSFAVPGYTFPVIMGTDYQRDASGHVIVNAQSGLPLVNNNIKILGSAAVKDQLGLNLNLSYKNVHFFVLFEYRGGNRIFNNGGPTYDWSGTSIRTVTFNRQRFVFPNSVYEDPNHPGTYIANKTAVIQNGNGNDGFWTDQTENMGVTSNYVTSGAFWKLRQMSISYDLPQKWASKTRVLKGATIALQGRNLFEWLPKSNIYTDPEFSDAGSASNGIGVTNLENPPVRYYGGSISLTF
ncbi:SusC/RagA family TonB-linked outer membrane protein [Dinghuibacter silviterrae]|uniref:TonB-linked SusC/RagA family outer membrane protein n=1 Tax=Dinghuibacter silviterrae TaxID=1539049 RepID=A0A4R8DPB4_9BACT|nr:SusC/RagA family TonB-linked outer membrane protein [Dinghuibacter silviterrae]TDW99136.1 TonB-linked SusC/RagA family outer membrane protein [Dinghuibacter silviterrae]